MEFTQEIEALDEYEIIQHVEFIDNIKVTDLGNMNPVSEKTTFMKNAFYPK